MGLAAAVSMSSLSSANADQFLFRFNGQGPAKLGGVVNPPVDPGPGSQTPDREQLTLTAPEDWVIRNYENVPAGVQASVTNAVANVSYSVSPALPNGLTLNANGTISGRAMVAAPETTYTITATDGVGGTLGIATASFKLAVEPRIPVAIDGASTFAFEQHETAKSVRLSPSDNVTIHGDAVWTPTSALPGWMTTAVDGNDLVISGSPTVVDAVGFDIGFTLADDFDVSEVHNLHVTVTPPASASIELPESIPADVTFLAAYYADVAAGTTLSKVDPADLTWTLDLSQPGDALPPGLEFASDGTLTGYPLAVGTYSFGVRAQGPNGLTASKRYTVSIHAEAVTRVASNSQTTCLKTIEGSLKCWGSNTNGLLGNGDTVSTTSDTPVDATLLTGTYVDVTGGYSGHMCALKDDGTVWCWGLGSSGQLGGGANATSRTPVQVTGLTDVHSISAGYKHTCAIKSDSSMWCWGEKLAIGDGGAANRNVPIQVPGMESGVIGMATGNAYSCAAKSDGTAWCWGAGANGRLGDGTTENRLSPVRVSGLTDLIAMTGGYDHTCATRADRTVWCWGSAQSGQLGNNATSPDALLPVQVIGLSDVYVLSTGDHHNCAIKTDRTVWCWGKNNRGQLGDGTTSTRSVPVQVQGFDNATSITAVGYTHTCATKSDGSAWCWGENNYGQLGNGQFGVSQSLPYRVSGT